MTSSNECENMDLSEWDDIVEAEPEKNPVKLKSDKNDKSDKSDDGVDDDDDWSDVIAIEVLENYCSNLMKQMESFRKEGTMCDAIIVVDNQELPVHKNILSSVSPFFKNIFSRLTGPNDNRITLRNLTGQIMDDILHFTYTGEACIHDGNVRQLVGTANFLQLHNLKEMGISYLEQKLCPANAVEILLIADKHQCDTLVLSAEKLIKDNFVLVSKTDGFMKLTFEMLHQFIQSEDIRVVKEEEVYEAVMTWMKSDFGVSTDKLNQMPDLFQEVRFPLMPPPYLREILEKEELVIRDKLCSDIIIDAEMYTLNKTKKPLLNSKMLQPRIFMGVVCGLVCPGGWHDNKPTKDVFAYITSDSKWYPLTPLPQARYSHSVISSDDYIYILGGRTETAQLLSSVIRFDTTVNNWQTVKSLPYEVASLGVCVFQGQIFVVGGLTGVGSIDIVLKYSPRYNSWQRVSNLMSPRSGAAVVAGEKFMYAIGGVSKRGNAANAHWEFLNTMEVYERESNTWRLGKEMLSKRAYGGAVYLDTKIYLVGGQGELMGESKGMDIYDTITQEWSNTVYHNVPRRLCGIAPNENEFFIIGGVSKGGDTVNIVETYNVVAKRWKKSTSLPIPIGAMQCCTMKLRLGVLQGMAVSYSA